MVINKNKKKRTTTKQLKTKDKKTVKNEIMICQAQLRHRDHGSLNLILEDKTRINAFLGPGRTNSSKRLASMPSFCWIRNRSKYS